MDNESRRQAAQEAINAHMEATMTKPEDNDENQTDLVDLLTNLRHWAHGLRNEGVDFNRAVITSLLHFENEA